jgi:transposase
MGTNHAPLLADLHHYSHKVDFTQEYLKKNEKKLAQSFNFTFHCIDDGNRMVVGFTTTCAISAYHH